MLSASSVDSLAGKLSRKIKDNPARGLFGAFLISIFFLKGALASVVAAVCFAVSWILIAREARDCKLPTPLVAPIVLAFLIVVGLRLLLPPYGIASAVPGTAESHVLLLAGLYGLILFVQSRLPFSHILWLLAGAAFVSVIITLVTMPQLDDRLSFVGRASNPILGAGAVAAGLIAAITVLAYHLDIRRAPLTAVLLAFTICGILAGLYLADSRGPLLALAFALCVTPLVVSSGSRALLFACAFGAYALVVAGVLLEGPIRHALCPAIELACRDPKRYDVWMQSVDTIAQHPLWGSGYAFRFEGIPHAHNTYLGMALYYGIPLAIFFVCLMAVALSKASRLKNRNEKFFIVAMLIFANGFMGSDLSEPVRFFNTHYVFLWLPIFLAMVRPQIAQRESAQLDERINATT
ncbi:integrase family protein [Hyphomicrobium denitrificans 1NES1]|uniref:Integrase family protein n=1 Tax=Hyphomicrobium denitrificans 1NES1 TaxID=670307 RepID=N0B275_9HYPH|nr:O-antigen ligase family protein [Hyphomicrobium denitrificans]AGK56307.1 integrase family protein [Hyphomicrobium denitrificans 1NES1]